MASLRSLPAIMPDVRLAGEPYFRVSVFIGAGHGSSAGMRHWHRRPFVPVRSGVDTRDQTGREAVPADRAQLIRQATCAPPDVPSAAPSVAWPHAHAAWWCTRRGDCADPGNRRCSSGGRNCLGSLPDTHGRSGQRPLHAVFSAGHRMPPGHRSLLSPPSSALGSPC